jgi:hypothetical protein
MNASGWRAGERMGWLRAGRRARMSLGGAKRARLCLEQREIPYLIGRKLAEMMKHPMRAFLHRTTPSPPSDGARSKAVMVIVRVMVMVIERLPE